jgi:methionyl-tRNA formyltransferase
MRIIFMGTPEFAVPSLEILIENGYEVVAVVTATDKPGGRGGKQLLESAVKKYAVSKGIPVLQPKNLKAPEFIEALRSYRADLQVVVAFRMLPEAVWDMPTIGTFNLHGSLLPKYRGAAPINWAVIEGEKETGVTTFFIKHEIDTGDILFQKKLPIGPDETAGEVHDRMMLLGAELVLETVQAIEKGGYILQKQDETQVSKAPKIFHETCEIDFNQPALNVHNFVRGLSPYPGAWAHLHWSQDSGQDRYEGEVVKIFKTEKITEAHKHTPGEFVTDGRKSLKIATADGYVEVLELQAPGRRRMDAVSFLNGLKS